MNSKAADLLAAIDRLEEVALMGRDAPEGAFKEATQRVQEARAEALAEIERLRRNDA